MGKLTDKLQLEALRAKRKALKPVQKNGIIISQKVLEEIRETHCGACGKQAKKHPIPYFGERFCYECIDKMTHGIRTWK